ncbi:iron ABC transporter permease [Niameybacter massiliensis]|uniref:Iron ABC transporter permease n=1 Tax=Holtiella tumoricola TaxID=3018743 RepID=A0AA42IZT7_9FIRM|nr:MULTISPECIES: iron ABC transporter permease [Lachnospirales]MDA3730426.1 iron ABC transporter permease [Holtiella tumoricola]
MKKPQSAKTFYKIYGILAVVTLVLAILSIAIGASRIHPFDVCKVLFYSLLGGDYKELVDAGQLMVIIQLRIPRILMALLTGINLAVTGAIYQALFKNDMADPFMLGISSGASLGAGIGFMLGGFSPLYAFLGALVANILVNTLAGTKGKTSTIRLLLSGLAINYFFSAILSLIRTYSDNKNLTLFAWGMGSLSGASYPRVLLLSLLTFPILCCFFFYRKELNLLLMGEDAAKAMGVDVLKLRKVFLILSSLLIATTVSFTGTIGFVGLIIPHMVRLLFGANYRKTLPITGLLGMIFVLCCDNLSRALLGSSEIPIGIITSLFGAPYFMYLIYKERKRSML